RPLAQSFVDMGNEVYCFFSGACNKKYDWRLKPYVNINKTDFSFECAELVNSPCWSFNFRNPDADISEKQTERLFNKYLDQIKPDVMHIHSRLGLPASIAKFAKDREITVINTIHVYGYLCQKRVMIDFLGNACEGPSDLRKCAICARKLNIRKEKFSARVANSSKYLHNIMVKAKRLLYGVPVSQRTDELHKSVSTVTDVALINGLTRRLEYMVNIINSVSDITICVSEDVKRTLMRFGAHQDKLLVQHIGSLIAETQTPRKKHLQDPLVIGNIGGVHHYKGTHILIDAVEKMKSKNFKVMIFGKFDEGYKSQLMEGREQLPVEFTGRYVPADLPGILEQIDVMVLPSICNDTAPQTIFESYSSYVPIVASNIGGFPDFVEDRIN